MEDKKLCTELYEPSAATIRFTSEAEKECYVQIRGSLIKLLYMIEAEQRGEDPADIWFYGFMHELASSNDLCHGKLTKVVVKIHGLYNNNHYREMTHEQIKRQIMESRGIVDHLIKEMDSKSK